MCLVLFCNWGVPWGMFWTGIWVTTSLFLGDLNKAFHTLGYIIFYLKSIWLTSLFSFKPWGNLPFAF